MSFMKTLAKVAIGVAIAKGVGGMIQSRQGGSGSTSAGGGGLFGGPNLPGARGTSSGGAPGGLQDIMRDVLAGTPGAGRAPRQANPGRQGSQSSGADMGGLGGLLEQLAGATSATTAATRKTTGAGGGGLDDLLGQLTRGGGGGLGDILGGLAGALGGAAAGSAMGGASETRTPSKPQAKQADASFGDLLNQSLQNYGEPDTPPAPQQEAAAALMLRAMIQAAKADGKVDEGERAKLLDNLKDGTKEELDFVKAELAAPVDIEGLARQVPKGLEGQIYTMSVMAITLDNKLEAQYLHQLAQALGLDPQQVNDMHAQLGVPALYA